MGSRHRPGTAPGPADDRPSTLRAPADDPTPITQLKVRTRAKSITGFSLSKPVPGFKTGSRLTSLVWGTEVPSGAQRRRRPILKITIANIVSCDHCINIELVTLAEWIKFIVSFIIIFGTVSFPIIRSRDGEEICFQQCQHFHVQK